MAREKNPYTQETGYVYGYTDYPNGWFIVLDRSKLGHAWYSEPDQHRWLVKKMSEGATKTAQTKDAAIQVAITSARSMSDYERWW